jgi:hypothetical protein
LRRERRWYKDAVTLSLALLGYPFGWVTTQWVDEDEQEGAEGIDESDFSGPGAGGSEYRSLCLAIRGVTCLSDVVVTVGGMDAGAYRKAFQKTHPNTRHPAQQQILRGLEKSVPRAQPLPIQPATSHSDRRERAECIHKLGVVLLDQENTRRQQRGSCRHSRSTTNSTTSEARRSASACWASSVLTNRSTTRRRRG